METLRWFLSGLGDLLRGYFDLWVRGVGALAIEFGLDLPQGLIELSALFLAAVSIIAFVNVLVKWDRKGNQPQSITFKTDKSPDQVVADDRNKFLMLLLRVSLFMLLLAVVMSMRG